MSQKVLNQIRDAVLGGRYAMSEHAYDEMDEDNLVSWTWKRRFSAGGSSRH